MLVRGRWSPETVSLCPRNHQGISSLLLVENRRIQRDAKGRSIGHGYHLNKILMKKDGQNGTINYLPQILIGASSSSRIGWLIKISLAFVHKYLISYSASWTGFPGRLPRTKSTKTRCQRDDRQSRTLLDKR